jgi:hypothetical protein
MITDVYEITATTTEQSKTLTNIARSTLFIETDADIRVSVNVNTKYTTIKAQNSPYYLTSERDTFNKVFIKTLSGTASVTIRHG